MVASTKSTKFGERLIPDIVDDRARDHPQQEAFQVPRSADPSAGWRVVTWKEFANAVNHVAWRMIEVNGEPEKNTFPTLAYIGPNDVRYVVCLPIAVSPRFETRLTY